MQRRLTTLAVMAIFFLFIAAIASATIMVKEGELVKVQVSAEDPDNDNLQYYYTYPLNSSGEWQTKRGDAGNYTAQVTVTDGELSDKKEVLIQVLSSNHAPVISFPETLQVEETDRVDIDPIVTDEDGDPVTVSISGWMSQRSYQTTYDDAGTHIVTIAATDGMATTEKQVLVDVKDRNRKPRVEATESWAKEGEMVYLNFNASDEDNDNVTVTISGWMNARKKQTGYNDAGDHEVVITADDGKDKVTKTVMVRIQDVDRSPKVIFAKNAYHLNEGDTIEIPFKATDPDGDSIKIEGKDLPSGMRLAEGKLVYTAPFDAADNKRPVKAFYPTVIALSKEQNDWKSVQVLVHNKNRPPTIDQRSPSADFYVDTKAHFWANASDPDGDELEYTWQFGMFEAYVDGPDHVRVFSTAGDKTIKLTVSDGKDKASQSWNVGVYDRPKQVTYEKPFVQVVVVQQPQDPNVLVIRN